MRMASARKAGVEATTQAAAKIPAKIPAKIAAKNRMISTPRSSSTSHRDPRFNHSMRFSPPVCSAKADTATSRHNPR
jgi:hypothetical protein